MLLSSEPPVGGEEDPQPTHVFVLKINVKKRNELNQEETPCSATATNTSAP